MLFACIVHVAASQQLPQYTLFTLNPYPFNPAIAGTEDFIHARAGARTQWLGIKGAPTTAYLSAHGTLTKRSIGHRAAKHFETERWLSMGAIFVKDNTGPLTWNSGYLTMAYNIPVTKQGTRLSFAVNAGVKGIAYDPAGYQVNIKDGQDLVINTPFRRSQFDMAAGVWLYNSKMFFGFSTFQLLKSAILDYGYEYTNRTISEGKLFRHYFLMSGLRIDMSKDLYMVPSVLLKGLENAALSLEVSTKFVYHRSCWAGVSYRKADSFSLLAGVLVGSKFEVSYAYDAITSRMRLASTGSHGIMIGYRFNRKAKTLCPEMFW